MKLEMKTIGVVALGLLCLFASDARVETMPAASNQDAAVSEKKPAKSNVRKRKKIVKKVAPPTAAEKTTAKLNAVPTKNQNSSLQAWLKKMKKRVARSQAKHNQVVAVASVRGSESNEPTPLYWKGQSAEGPVSPEELAQFDEAIELALNGDNSNAKTKLESFISSNPKSSLVADARETLKTLEPEDQIAQ